jgi:MerR family transcriptional regulator, light-induced transcriptional regulator
MEIWSQQFSIKDLENFTGIKAHTIRAWEQRYDLLKPERTDTNIRYYTDKDLKLLLNIELLCKLGYKISKIANMSEKQMQEIIVNAESLDTQEQHYLNMLKVSMLSYDEELFYHVTNQFLSSHSKAEAIEKLFLPFLQKIGLLWVTSAICPAQEHFVSNLIRQKLYAWVDEKQGKFNEDSDVYVLYLPEMEIHEISLLMLHFLARDRGYRSVFLGQSVPAEDLPLIAQKFKSINFVSFCTTKPSTNDVESYLKKLQLIFGNSDCTFHFAGPVFNLVKAPADGFIRVYEKAEVLLEQLFSKVSV